ncbi:MAG TPA: [LysW]-lysine hydrolase [Candidatus Methylomirabilis sp.]|nr:[LysW]-lysine hydrolase [Candidatus Methylomirabilis sp.]
MDPVGLLQRMVEIPSLSGEEAALAAFLVESMDSLGFRASVDPAGNAVGVLGDGPVEIVLLGHMDTVPGVVPVRVEDGQLYGRGSVDAKGSLAAFIAAVAQVGPLPGKRIIVVGATEEEAASSKGARHASQVFQPACCVIGEPSGAHAVTLGYKGRIVCAYEASATATHSASKEGSILEKGVEFWNRIRRWADESSAGKKMFDRLDPALREIRSEHDGLTESIQLRLSIRIPPGLSPEAVRRHVEGLSTEPGQLRFWGADPPYRAEKNTPLVRAFLKSIREQGGDPAFKVKSGTSDMNVVGPVWNCPMVAYGPGDSNLDHTPHEHLDLAEYRLAIAILARVLRLL